MKRLLTILVLLTLTCASTFGQLDRGHATTKFNYRQIDSLVKVNQKSLGNDSFFIAHKIFYPGSHVTKGEIHYENPFDLLFYYKQNGRYYIKRINNFGESEIKDYSSKNLFKFLSDNFSIMQKEELQIHKRDTTERKKYVNEDGDTTVSYSITTWDVTDHQRFDTFWINYNGQFLKYYFPAECNEIKANLTKKQYLFLLLLQQTTDKAKKKLKQ